MKSAEGSTDVLLGIAGLASVALATNIIANLVTGTEYKVFPYYKFVDLESSKEIAQVMSGYSDDEFIYKAWLLVSEGVQYVPVASDIVFTNGSVRCKSCLMPHQILAQENPKGNCVAKSALLLSLLRHRFPPESVYLVMGQLNVNGAGGHAWVELQRNNQWYVLESTISPRKTTARPAESLALVYVPEVFVNDLYRHCLSGKVCIGVDKKGCPCYFENGV